MASPQLWAQQWETIKMYDFSDPNFMDNLGGVNGFQASHGFLSNNGATGALGDLCAYLSASTSQAYIAMRQPLLAGEVYRLALNGKTTNASQMSYYYGEYAGPFFMTSQISAGMPLPTVLSPQQPGTDLQTVTFTVPADGMYWLTAHKATSGTAWLDNFALQRQVPELPSFSLTLDGAPAPELIEAAAGVSFELCLVPDAPPSEALDVGIAVQGGGSPHFPGYAHSLSFPAGSSAPQCFTLSPADEDGEESYLFDISLGSETVEVFKVQVSPGCSSVAGPDRTICAGESTQLGTGCLPAPHPLEGVEYCYRWVPAEGLDDPSGAMPTATPSETTIYTVYVTTSEGEMIVAEDVVVTVASPLVSITASDNSICFRGLPGARPTVPPQRSGTACPAESATLWIDGQYTSTSWSDGSTGSSIIVDEPGLYGVTVTDEMGCSSTAELAIAACTAQPFAIEASAPQLCPESVLLSAASGFDSYEWSDGSAGNTLLITDAGTYALTVVDNNGCTAVESIAIGVCNPLVDITIHNGLYDWQTNTSWSGGNAVPDPDEDSNGIGAVTVANMNDTDGDDIPDFLDREVVASAVGRNEIDLMRFVVHKPVPYSGGPVILTVLQGQDRLKFWTHPQKRDSLLQSDTYEVFFAGGASSVVYYLEAMAPSSAVRDIVIMAEYYGQTDEVAATAVWVDPARQWLVRTPGVNPMTNPIPAVDIPSLMANDPLNLISMNIASDGSRYGFGTLRGTPQAIDSKIGGRILMEFAIQPQGINALLQLYGPMDKRLRFDLSRRRQSRTLGVLTGTGRLIPFFNDPARNLVPFPPQVELANDDSQQSTDEDLNPSNDLIYSYDAPALQRWVTEDTDPNGGANIYIHDYVISTSSFEEFARVHFSSNPLLPMSNGNILLGSRASGNFQWSKSGFYKRDIATLLGATPQAMLVSDNQPISFSEPRRFGQGNGNIQIVPSSTLPTGFLRSYRVSYLSGNRWQLDAISSNQVVANTLSGAPGDTTWVLELPNEVQVTISQGTLPFVFLNSGQTSRFAFSVYATPNKPNFIRLGP